MSFPVGLPGTSAAYTPPAFAVDAPAGGAVSGAAGPTFQDVLLRSIDEVNEFDRQAQTAIAGALSGGDLTQSEVLASMKKADLAFRTMIQIRNKLVDAYNEVKNMRM